jgi:hypothetical protein
MGAIDAFDVMTDAVSRNPILLGAAAVIGVASTVLNTAGQIPLVGLLVGLLYFLVEPYLAGGFLGMANQAVSGDTSFDDFTTSASDHYSDLLVARLVVAIPFVIYLVLVSLVGGLIVGLGAMGMGGGTGTGTEPTAASPELMGAVGVIGLVVLLAAFVIYAIPFFFLQFYPAAIVIGDADPMESFKYSYKLVKANIVPALGYTAIAFVAGLVLLVPSILSGQGQVVGRALGQAATDSAAGGFVSGFFARLVVFAVTFLVCKTLVVGVLRTYYVAFVRSITGTA